MFTRSLQIYILSIVQGLWVGWGGVEWVDYGGCAICFFCGAPSADV